MPTTHLITGATGLIGAALVLHLAEHTDDEFVCLVRPPVGRLPDMLRRSAEAYGTRPEVLDSALRRTRTLEADLTARTLPPLRVPRPHVWHCAAALHFRRAHWRPVFHTNVRGTRRVLELARRLDSPAFTYFSTAYVAGTTTGTIKETPATPSTARTPYELSKIAAERLLLNAPDIPVHILRPSVVVGHSETLAYPGTPSGAYTIQQLLAAHYRALPPPTTHPRIQALPLEPFNIVPIDHVVREAHELTIRAEPGGIHHLTNPTPPTTDALLCALLANCRAPSPTYTHTPDPVLRMTLGVYAPYLNNPQHFTRTHPGTPWLPDQETLRAMFRPFA
ncbi:SDR family oxidoreductase [Streptomyces sp. NPDC004539]|uniref:SDR family oxidoreductase n=1 Tax=Streptomyces sp. NPDC004539 TaxID=3154280 RepID=UPI0033B4C1C3